MTENSKKNRSFIRKLTDQYRLIIIDEDTFEHKVDFSLSRLNVIVVIGAMAFFFTGLTAFLISSTSLREYIPGYPSVDFKRQIYRMNKQLDSLENEVQLRNQYLDQLRLILSGDIKPEEWDKTVPAGDTAEKIRIDTLALQPSEADLQLRKEVEEKEKFATEGIAVTEGSVFIPPLRGYISQEFDLKKKHAGIDIVVKQKTPVKAIAAGTVIFSGWTPDNGNVLIIQHPGNWISVYKHNHKIMKRQGDAVIAGEVIAISGDTGTNSTGPHLHFELWKDGRPVDPANYLDFQPEY